MQRNVWILGGTSGLGKEVARYALECGDRIAVLGRRADKMEQEPPFNGEDVWRVNIDLRHPPGITGALASALERFHPDVLVWTSGVAQHSGFLDLTFPQIDELIAVHLRGPLYLLRRVMACARDRRKPLQLIVVSSTSAWLARCDEEVYGAVHAAKSVFARQVSVMLARDIPGSSVFLANVCGMNTPFWEGMSKDTGALLDPALIASSLWRNAAAVWEERLAFSEMNIVPSTEASYRVIDGPQAPEMPH